MHRICHFPRRLNALADNRSSLRKGAHQRRFFFYADVCLRLPESSIAPYLTELQARTKGDGIRVGSYPLLLHGVYVSLIGQDAQAIQTLAEEVAKKLDGRLVTDEEAREMVKQKERGAA